MSLATVGNMPQILAIEAALKQCEQAEYKVEHYQIEGVYVRVLHLKAGTVLTGKVHKKEHISILAHGTIQVADKDKSGTISAPYVMVDRPGIMRVGHAVTDVTFINVLRTDKTDIAEIEAEAVCNTVEEFEQLWGEKWHSLEQQQA